MREIKCEQCSTIVIKLESGSLRNDTVLLCAPCFNMIVGKVRALEERIENAEKVVGIAPPGFLQGLFGGKSKKNEDV